MHNEIDFSLLTASQPSRQVDGGTIIFSSGEPAGEMFIVKSGSVEIRLGDRVIETVSSNGVFGEMALIDGDARSAAAIAVGPTELVPINEKQFLYLVGETPYFALNMLRTLSRRLRATNPAGE